MDDERPAPGFSHLADEPVEAQPPSVRYRLGKFVRRHKGPVLAAALVLLALVAGIAGTTWGLVRAERARDAEAGAVSFRYRDGSQRNGVPVAEAVAQIADWIASRSNLDPSAAEESEQTVVAG